jgi:hypothetical protein
MQATVTAQADRIMLLILAGEDCRKAILAAFDHAKSNAKQLHVVQILNSDLYPYGHQDLVATRHSKRQFLLYIRDEVLKRGEAEARVLNESARRIGISMEVHAIESEDVLSAALSEAIKGYDIIFLPKAKKKIFPLFERNFARYLQNKTSCRVVPC